MGIEYELQESTRARNVRVTVHPDGRVVVTKPARVSTQSVEKWLRGKELWIADMRAKFEKQQRRFEKQHGVPISVPRLRRGTKPYNATIAQARKLVTERTQHYAALGAYTYGAISIRNQKTRWGSCSTKKNLSFNYRLVHLPPALVDYVVVHELAHTEHHNHGAEFWAAVGRLIPDYEALRNELHRYRF